MPSTYTWTLESGTIPPGTTLSLSDTDLDITLTGTPTTAGTYNFTVRVTNDISAAFDDQAFTVFIDLTAIQITPDLGLSVSEAFDPSINKHLIEIATGLFSDLGDLPELLHQPLDNLSLNVDIGAGVRRYQMPQDKLRSFTVRNRIYLYRMNLTPETIKAVFIV